MNPADPVSRPFSFSSAADIISASINVSLTPCVGASCQIGTVVCTKSGGGGLSFQVGIVLFYHAGYSAGVCCRMLVLGQSNVVCVTVSWAEHGRG